MLAALGKRLTLAGRIYFSRIAVKEFFWASEFSKELYKKEIEILIKVWCFRNENLVISASTSKHHSIVRNTLGWAGCHTIFGLCYGICRRPQSSRWSSILQILILQTSVIYYPAKQYGTPEICSWIVQVSRGLQYIHRCQIIHRNIKPSKWKG